MIMNAHMVRYDSFGETLEPVKIVYINEGDVSKNKKRFPNLGKRFSKIIRSILEKLKMAFVHLMRTLEKSREKHNRIMHDISDGKGNWYSIR